MQQSLRRPRIRSAFVLGAMLVAVAVTPASANPGVGGCPQGGEYTSFTFAEITATYPGITATALTPIDLNGNRMLCMSPEKNGRVRVIDDTVQSAASSE